MEMKCYGGNHGNVQSSYGKLDRSKVIYQVASSPFHLRPSALLTTAEQNPIFFVHLRHGVQSHECYAKTLLL